MAFIYARCHRRNGHASGIQSLGIVVSLEEPRKEGWKPSLDALDAIVADDINRVNRLIVEKMESRAPLIPQLAGHIVAAGGKRLRPMLTLAASRLCGYEGDRHIALESVEPSRMPSWLRTDRRRPRRPTPLLRTGLRPAGRCTSCTPRRRRHARRLRRNNGDAIMSAEVTASPPGVDRQRVVRRATLLNRLTIGWNAVEGIVAIAAGVAASSIGLVAFGLDSGIEVSAALILAWRLHQERRDGCKLEADDRAHVRRKVWNTLLRALTCSCQLVQNH